MADHDKEKMLAGFADHLFENSFTDEKHGRYMVG